MANYEETRVRLTKQITKPTQVCRKNKTVTTLRITKKNFEDEELTHKLFLTTRQKTKIGNAFANNMSTDINFSKTKISKIIELGKFLGSWLGKTVGNLCKKEITDIFIPLATDNLARLVRNIALK